MKPWFVIPSGRKPQGNCYPEGTAEGRGASAPQAHPHAGRLAPLSMTSVWVLVFALLLFHPQPGHAYAGPGAGFAVLSSFWTLFVAFLYSLYALFTWPFRH